jgi:hypothetical protein
VPSAAERVLSAPAFRGLPSARIQLRPTLSLTEEYTDNFNLTERDKESNFRSTIAPGLELGLNMAFLKGLIAYKFAPSHDSSTEEISYFHSLAGQVEWDVTPRWKLTLADAFTRSDAPGEADRLGLRQQRQAFTSNIGSITSDYLIGLVATRASYQLSTFSDDSGSDTTSHTLAGSATMPLYQTNSVSLGYEYLDTRTTGGNDTSTLPTNTGIVSIGNDVDITGHRFTAGFNRQLSRLRTAGVTGSYALRTVTDQTGDFDYRIWNVSFVTDYDLGGRLKLSSQIGVSGLQGSGSQTVGPNLSTRTSLTYSVARVVASFLAEKGFSETFAEGQNFGVVETEGVTGSLSYDFTPSITGVATGFYRQNKTATIGDAQQAQATGQALGAQETKSWGGTVSFTWKVTRVLGIELGYTYTKQEGSDEGRTSQTPGTDLIQNSYTENRIRAAVNVSF